MLTLGLAARPMVSFQIVYCSVGLPCSDSLPCGEELTPRFYWNF